MNETMTFDELCEKFSNTNHYVFLYSILDTVSNEYTPPTVFKSLAVALRYFGDLCQKDPVIQKHSMDFGLYCIGGFNTVTGEIDSIKPARMSSAFEFVNSPSAE